MRVALARKRSPEVSTCSQTITAIIIMAVGDSLAVAAACVVPRGANLVLYVGAPETCEIDRVRQLRVDGITFVGSARKTGAIFANHVALVVIDRKEAVNGISRNLRTALIDAVATAAGSA